MDTKQRYNRAGELDVEILRREEYGRLEGNPVYVDYTGGGQCPFSVYERYHQLLIHEVLGNPHSKNPASERATELITEARRTLLEYFHAQEEYELIFTPNASGALKLLAEAYPWNHETVLILAKDNHNSVNGMREFAKRGGAQVEYWELDEALRLKANLGELISRHKGKRAVVALPAQSNFSGVIHPQSLIDEAHHHGATVFWDTAAYVPTHSLDLKDKRPEALFISFYKILGFPTGLGALMVRKDLLEKLSRPSFAGGTVRGVSFHEHLSQKGYAGFEDGTLNYLNIPALTFVVDFLKSIGGVETINRHVQKLTAHILAELNEIGNLKVYGPTDMKDRGATLAFNILTRGDNPVHYQKLEQLAASSRISLRAGRFCNPGAASKALGITDEKMKMEIGRLRKDPEAKIDLPGAGRISFGIGNTTRDVEKVVDFIKKVASKV